MNAHKGGRPCQAATSLEDALAAWRCGAAPKRPRNAFEREARKQQGLSRGRRVNPQSRTRAAAELALYLETWEGLSRTSAARRAADLLAGTAGAVHKRDIQAMAVKLAAGPQVRMRSPANRHSPASSVFALRPATVPLVEGIADASGYGGEFPWPEWPYPPGTALTVR